VNITSVSLDLKVYNYISLTYDLMFIPNYIFHLLNHGLQKTCFQNIKVSFKDVQNLLITFLRTIQ